MPVIERRRTNSRRRSARGDGGPPPALTSGGSGESTLAQARGRYPRLVYTLVQLEEAIRQSWGPDTVDPDDGWSEDNPHAATAMSPRLSSTI
jgi:hypothetical protein